MKILESYTELAKSLFVEEDVKDKKIKFKDKDGNDKESTVGGILKKGEKHPAYDDAKAVMDKGKDGEKEEPSGKLGAGDFERDTDTTRGDPDDSWDDEEGRAKPKSPEEWFGDDESGLKTYGHEGAPESISDVQDLISLATPTGKWFNKAMDGVESGRIKKMSQSVLDSIKKAAANPKVHVSGPEGEAMIIKYFEDKIESGDIEIVKGEPKAEPKKKRKAIGTTRSIGYRGSNY